MQTVKMVVTGAVAAGKTEFINAISEIAVISTERKATDETSLVKKDTTVAMDFGSLTVAEDLRLLLFGTPGQKRFDFMWEILAEGMLGLVVLVDSTRPDTFRETARILEFFTTYRHTPYVIACNKQDLDNAWSPQDIRYSLRIPEQIKVLACTAKDRESVKTILLELLYTILEQAEDD